MRILLQKWRERLGLTQAQLAARAGVHVATVTRIENGSDTYVGTVEKLAHALGKSPSGLIEWDEASGKASGS